MSLPVSEAGVASVLLLLFLTEEPPGSSTVLFMVKCFLMKPVTEETDIDFDMVSALLSSDDEDSVGLVDLISLSSYDTHVSCVSY